MRVGVEMVQFYFKKWKKGVGKLKRKRLKFGGEVPFARAGGGVIRQKLAGGGVIRRWPVQVYTLKCIKYDTLQYV